MWLPDTKEDGQTTILPLWVSAFVFAHLFSGYWLLKSVLLTNPQLSLRRLLCCCFVRVKNADGLPSVQPGDGSGRELLEADLDEELATPKGRLAGDWDKR
jgi:hypothetical protein